MSGRERYTSILLGLTGVYVRVYPYISMTHFFEVSHIFQTVSSLIFLRKQNLVMKEVSKQFSYQKLRSLHTTRNINFIFEDVTYRMTREIHLIPQLQK